MPSINRYIEIHDEHRIRINTCEGHVGITDERRALSGTAKDRNWRGVAQIDMTRDQAVELIARLSDQLLKHY